MRPERRTGVVYDPRCLAHVNPAGGVAPGTLPPWATVEAFERPERLSLTRRVLEASGALAWLTELQPRLATQQELALAHSDAHVERSIPDAKAFGSKAG